MWVLKDSERDLVRELEPERMDELDEDELLELHRGIRRARNKQVKNYRRKAAKNVGKAGGRGTGKPANQKSRHRASAFEEALAIVSERLAVVAHTEALALKDERLARARRGKSSGPHAEPASSPGTPAEGSAREHEKSLGAMKRDASSRAQRARRQGKRDSR